MRDSKCSSPYKENRQLLSYKGSCVISVKVDHGRQREGRKNGTFNTTCNFFNKKSDIMSLKVNHINVLLVMYTKKF